MPALIKLPREACATMTLEDMPLQKAYHVTEELKGYGESIWLAASLAPNTNSYLPGKKMNALVRAAHTAYSKHNGLVLSPDVVWVTILGGVAIAINKDPERFRSKLVKHEGKKTLVVFNPNLLKKFGTEALQDTGNMNSWSETMRTFPSKMKPHFVHPDLCDMALCDFSTSSIVDKTVSSIMLMECAKAFFDYRCETCCGISHIQLSGTKEDWVQVLHKTQRFLDIVEMKTWLSVLQTVLGQFVAVFDGDINVEFWDSFYKWTVPGSGSDEVHGWINAFFPFVGDNLKPNSFLNTLDGGLLKSMLGNKGTQKKKGQGDARWGGPSIDDFPLLLSSVPMQWGFYGEELALKIFAGVCLIEATGDSLVPTNGWILVSDEWSPGIPSATGVPSVTVHRYCILLKEGTPEDEGKQVIETCTSLLEEFTDGYRVVYDQHSHPYKEQKPNLLSMLEELWCNLPEAAIDELHRRVGGVIIKTINCEKL